MIIELKYNVTPKQIAALSDLIRQHGRTPRLLNGLKQIVFNISAVTGAIRDRLQEFRTLPFVDDLLETETAPDCYEIRLFFKLNAIEENVWDTMARLSALHCRYVRSEGERRIMIDPVDDALADTLRQLPYVDSVMPAGRRYKLVSREYCRTDSAVSIGGAVIGRGNFQFIAGPCAVESLEQMRTAAAALTRAGVRIIRGGAFKPRTSPYDFQGLGREGLDILRQIKEEFGVAVTTEAVSTETLREVAEVADCIQIGARNAQNYNLLERVADTGKPVLLKRGMASTVEEWFSAAEYLMARGCFEVILCERGIKTFESATRNTLDLSAVVIAKRETHLPVVVDPCHAAGRLALIPGLSRAAIAAGADGLIVEAHPNPPEALSDAAQQIPTADFAQYKDDLQPFIALMEKYQ
ncbi:MAG: bifunctional 3-deoxy-7-phosphoheptulonate synthase/chorismate mutase [Victivallales bacterium]|nr:bifunctional 3-deoxy-7-phosphoheptulonate synthase/chorismate mutase [Victivallales bacterium]